MISRLLSISSLLVIFCSYAQKKVELTINPTSVEVGETFSITVTSTVDGTLNFDKVPSSFVQDYNIHQGSNREIDYNTGNVKIVHFYSFTGIITKSGKFTFGPAYITKGSKSYPSNSATINIGKRVPMSSGSVSAQQLQDPAFGLIEVNKKTIYEGEPLLISAKVYAKYNPSHVGVYKSYGVPGTTIKHPIGNTTSFKKSIEKFKGVEYYSFSYDKNVIFPSGIGSFQVDPFKMNLHQGYQNFPLVSNGFNITILPLPANPPSDFIGAVGDFRVDREIDAKSIKQGDVIKMTIAVAGIGNLQNIIEPSLNLPKGFTVYGDPVITENFSVGLHGTEGEIVYEYNIEVRKSGDITLPASTISFFNPSKKKYIQATSNEVQLSIEKNDNYIVHETTLDEEKDTELVIHRSKIKEKVDLVNIDSFYGTGAFWGGIGAPILASFLFVLFARRKDKSEDKAVIKRQKAEKDAVFKEYVSIAKSLMESGSDSEYYSHIENALRKAFEIDMEFEEDRLITKNDISSFIEKTYNSSLNNSVSEIFNTCEQSKYGFASTNTSRKEIIDQLKEIVSKLNKVKW